MHLFIFLVFLHFINCKRKLSEDDCSNLGYKPDLKCQSCSDLTDFGLDALQSSCLQCCKDGEHETTSLEVGL
ncbi:hypothetical protein GJ496_007727 [Pomphorhynchus laevis]|nr:hypothetical protein GJ496_007727 [Pomphorhynchus laevis]